MVSGEHFSVRYLYFLYNELKASSAFWTSENQMEKLF